MTITSVCMHMGFIANYTSPPPYELDVLDIDRNVLINYGEMVTVASLLALSASLNSLFCQGILGRRNIGWF